MPRKPKQHLTVEEYPEYGPQRFYVLRIEGARTSRDSLKLHCLHLDRDQLGRSAELELPLPLRPAGITNQVLSCVLGQPLAGGQLVELPALRGRMFAACLSVAEDGVVTVAAVQAVGAAS